MACGILIVDKPAGWTSQDVVSKLRGVLHEKRIGHGGTLDPMATGVLPVFVGRATRAVEFFEAAHKEYVAHLRLGVTTDTQDTAGNVLKKSENIPSQGEISAILSSFMGEIGQIPPMYSAIKIGGKKLYELARQGKEVERKERKIRIFDLTLGEKLENGDYPLTVFCSKGTYVRTLCHDIGEKLGCGACMSSLRRTKAGMYDLSMATPLDEIASSPNPESLLLPVDSMFLHLPAFTLNRKQETACRHGNPIQNWHECDGLCRIYGEDGTFLMLGNAREGTLFTEKSFFEIT